jgi:hypothetical protein
MTFIPRNDNSIHRKDLNLTEPWTPRYRAENEALPPTLSIWDRPVYQSPKQEYVRHGAMDFMKVKSK